MGGRTSGVGTGSVGRARAKEMRMKRGDLLRIVRNPHIDDPERYKNVYVFLAHIPQNDLGPWNHILVIDPGGFWNVLSEYEVEVVE